MKTTLPPGTRSEGMDPEEGDLLMDAEEQRRRGNVRRQHTTQQAAASFLSSYVSRRFMSGW